jgi:hypothetical protein
MSTSTFLPHEATTTACLLHRLPLILRLSISLLYFRRPRSSLCCLERRGFRLCSRARRWKMAPARGESKERVTTQGTNTSRRKSTKDISLSRQLQTTISYLTPSSTSPNSGSKTSAPQSFPNPSTIPPTLPPVSIKATHPRSKAATSPKPKTVLGLSPLPLPRRPLLLLPLPLKAVTREEELLRSGLRRHRMCSGGWIGSWALLLLISRLGGG